MFLGIYNTTRVMCNLNYVMFVVLLFFTGFCFTGIIIVSTVFSNYIKCSTVKKP